MNKRKIVSVVILFMSSVVFSFSGGITETNGQVKLDKAKLVTCANSTNVIAVDEKEWGIGVQSIVSKKSEDAKVIPLPFIDRMGFDSIESKAIGRGRDLFNLDLYRTKSVSFAWMIWSDYPITPTGPNTDEFGTGLCIFWRLGK